MMGQCLLGQDAEFLGNTHTTIINSLYPYLRIDDWIEIFAEEKLEKSVKMEALTLEDAHVPALPQHFDDMLGVLLSGIILPLNFEEKSVERLDGHLPAAL